MGTLHSSLTLPMTWQILFMASVKSKEKVEHNTVVVPEKVEYGRLRTLAGERRHDTLYRNTSRNFSADQVTMTIHCVGKGEVQKAPYIPRTQLRSNVISHAIDVSVFTGTGFQSGIRATVVHDQYFLKPKRANRDPNIGNILWLHLLCLFVSSPGVSNV